MMRVQRARGTRSWRGAPRPAPPARGEVCISCIIPLKRASPTELNEPAPQSKFSEIGDHGAKVPTVVPDVDDRPQKSSEIDR